MRNQSIIQTFLNSVLSVCFLTFTTLAADLHVSTTGNDANNCLAPATACLTIQAAVNKSANGDSIFIGAGTFSGAVDIFDRANLRFVGTGAGTIVNHPGPAGPNVAVINVGASRLIEFNDFRLTGHGSSDGFRVFHCTRVTFNRMIVDSNGGPGGGFFINGSLGVMINNSTIEDNGIGIRVEGNSGATLSSPPFAPGNSIVQRNAIGIQIRSGNFALQGSGIVQNNGTGIRSDGGQLNFCCENEAAPRRINNNNTGILIRTGGNAEIRGSTEFIGNAGFALRQFGGGVSVTGNVLFRNNGTASGTAISQLGGHLFLQGFDPQPIVIENNPGIGIVATEGAATRLTFVTIRNNGSHGFRLGNLSYATLLGGLLFRDNGGKDLSCVPSSFATGDSTGIDHMFCPGFSTSPDPDGPND